MVMGKKLTTLMLCLVGFSAQADLGADLARSRSETIQQGRSVVSDQFISQLIDKHESVQVAEILDITQAERPTMPVASQDETYVILISSSMGNRELKQLFASLSHRDDVQFVVRGLLDSEKTITDVGKRIFHLVKDMNPVPNVTLDPRYFQQVDAEYAPQILMFRGEKLALSATGLTNPNYMREQFELGQRGDLGKFGDVVSIGEKDLTEVMLERASKLDTEQIKQDAKDRYWDKVQFVSLPEATETRIREFNPILTVHEDVVTPDDMIIAYAGQKFNPLEILPFSLRLVIFDATNSQHMDYVKSLPKTTKRTKYITTQYDRSLKWDAVKTVERELGAPIFQLQNDVISAFDLQVIPSIVIADNQRNIYVISETHLDAE